MAYLDKQSLWICTNIIKIIFKISILYAFISYLVTFLCPSQCYLSRLFFVLVQSTLSAGRDCRRVGPCPPPNVFTTVDRRYVENLFQDPENFHFFFQGNLIGWDTIIGLRDRIHNTSLSSYLTNGP